MRGVPGAGHEGGLEGAHTSESQRLRVVSSSWPHLVQLVRNVRTRSRLVESGQEHLKFPCLRIIWT